ncbi:MAG TPA: hypothetical protein VEC37_06250 [Bacillota bacterium]|nr:hypothetical protein [Bacillota bacterium]
MIECVRVVYDENDTEDPVWVIGRKIESGYEFYCPIRDKWYSNLLMASPYQSKEECEQKIKELVNNVSS